MFRARPWLWCTLLAGCSEVAAQSVPARPETGSTQSFVACPVYRDTDLGRKSGCWLADDAAAELRYDVTWAPIKPQIGKPVLVEGVVTEDADTCGGVVLKPVRVSVLPGRCARTIIPPEAFPGRPSPPPVDVLKPASEPRTLPPPPYERQEFQIYFEFGRDFLIYQHAEVVLEKVQLYVKASSARQVTISGFAATDPILRSGRVLAEPLSLAEQRAKMVALALHRLGIPDEIVSTESHGSPQVSDLEAGKLPESSKRRVTITVTP
ncbi:MAG TPA: OmpA family protein [Polyangiales bacterium]|nr:OmpA family protein [Polyangiales bacterium]